MKTALLIVDFQNDYFPSFEDAKFPLVGTEAAAEQGAKLLKVFRNKNLPVFHVRHVFVGENAPFFAENSNGVQFHPLFEPKEGETVITKHEINSFRGTTDLHAQLQAQGIERLLIIGAMSHMCIDAATRAAADLGYQCHVAHNACATRDLEFGGKTVAAADVHAAYMSALAFAYAGVDTADNLAKLV